LTLLVSFVGTCRLRAGRRGSPIGRSGRAAWP